MIVVEIIGILALIALPQYQNYLVRAQISEGVVLGDGVENAVLEYVYTNGAWPDSNADAGLPSPQSITGNYVSSVDVGGDIAIVGTSGCDGIHVTFGNKANSVIQGKTIGLRPGGATPDAGGSGATFVAAGCPLADYQHASSIHFTCVPESIVGDAASGFASPDLIPDRYLPSACRLSSLGNPGG